MDMQFTNRTIEQQLHRLQFQLRKSAGHWLAVDRDGLLVHVSEKLRVRIGYGLRSSLIGQHLEMLMPQSFRDEHKTLFRKWWDEKHSLPLIMNARNKSLIMMDSSGKEHEVAISVHPYDDEDPDAGLLVMRDDTMRTAGEKLDLIKNAEFAKAEVIFLKDLGLEGIAKGGQ